ncbi:unnamed protein product [Blepharisma stoltei]|uniref:Uncharacterized protein n=1 Tax=Blepharisma stoltei TaxID=1481888 RepID=A0AAU9ISQ2_9CILI|nr:unnamed protein product [Blepharisma stoltei]
MWHFLGKRQIKFYSVWTAIACLGEGSPQQLGAPKGDKSTPSLQKCVLLQGFANLELICVTFRWLVRAPSCCGEPSPRQAIAFIGYIGKHPFLWGNPYKKGVFTHCQTMHIKFFPMKKKFG